MPRQGERCVKVSETLWLEILKGRAIKRFRVLNPLPADAMVVRTGYDTAGILNVILRSKEWPELKYGSVIPDLEIKFETIHEETVAK